MEWIRAHPYVSALCAAGILVFVGILIVDWRSTRPVQRQATVWGGGGTGLLNPTSYDPTQNTTSQGGGSIMEQVTSGPPYTYTPPVGVAESAPSQNTGPYDFETFVAMLIKETTPKKQGGTGADSSVIEAYSYIPRGLISTTTPTVSRTALQQALYEYGNDIGSSIESFEQQHSNMVQLLKEQVEDRGNADKAEAVVNLGRSFQGLGTNLASMDSVPSAIVSAHQALAQSYIEIGKKLALVPQAERDSDFIEAIKTYNAAADTFTKNYIQIAALFGAHGVIFASMDGGRVFTFSPTGF